MCRLEGKNLILLKGKQHLCTLLLYSQAGHWLFLQWHFGTSVCVVHLPFKPLFLLRVCLIWIFSLSQITRSPFAYSNSNCTVQWQFSFISLSIFLCIPALPFISLLATAFLSIHNRSQSIEWGVVLVMVVVQCFPAV